MEITLPGYIINNFFLIIKIEIENLIEIEIFEIKWFIRHYKLSMILLLRISFILGFSCIIDLISITFTKVFTIINLVMFSNIA